MDTLADADFNFKNIHKLLTYSVHAYQLKKALIYFMSIMDFQNNTSHFESVLILSKVRKYNRTHVIRSKHSINVKND